MFVVLKSRGHKQFTDDIVFTSLTVLASLTVQIPFIKKTGMGNKQNVENNFGSFIWIDLNDISYVYSH